MIDPVGQKANGAWNLVDEKRKGDYHGQKYGAATD